MYGFLTIEPNAAVATIHPKAMPLILTTTEDYDIWRRALDEAKALQLPLPDDELKIVPRVRLKVKLLPGRVRDYC